MTRTKRKDIDELMEEFQKRMVHHSSKYSEDNVPKARRKWSADKYFKLLADLMEEMVMHGYIKKPKVGFTNAVTDLGPKELSESRLDLVIRAHDTRELSDKEIVNNWGLGKGRKPLTPKEVINVDRIARELEVLFEEGVE